MESTITEITVSLSIENGQTAYGVGLTIEEAISNAVLAAFEELGLTIVVKEIK